MKTNESEAVSSRRRFMAAGAGLAMTDAATAHGQTSGPNEGREGAMRLEMQHPLKQYAQPPYKKQLPVRSGGR